MSTADPSADAGAGPAPPTSSPAAAPAPSRRCENCGAPLLGEHCYACGQPTRGLVRHFSSVIGDFFDTVFNIDSRVLRTLGPLLAKPGWLTLEYFEGRRVRYVTPTRLFLFLSLLAFFAIHARIEVGDEGGDGGDGGITVGAPREAVTVRSPEIEQATTVAQVEAARAQALARIDANIAGLKDTPAAAPGVVAMEKARERIIASADARIAWIRARDQAIASGKPAPESPGPLRPRGGSINFPVNGKPWDPVANPVAFAWLPDAANQALNRRMLHAREELDRDGSQRTLVEALFNVLPQTLIVLMPIFALMLKLAYFFKRRLYMEHLIVALHSHGFIALALTLVMGFSWLQETFGARSGFLDNLFGWGIGLTSAWIPVYLLLMQKRVYGQGWLMTLVKFSVLGFLYSILLGFGMAAALLIGLLTL
jgi:hypothetical protein